MTHESSRQSDLARRLNAYLDGELTPAQAEKIKQLVAKDPNARRLLEELRYVAASVAGLPKESPSRDLTEAIQRQAERELLLAENDQLSELAGQKHLQWRRFFAAAAMIMLAASIMAIVYSVLYGPNKGGPNGPAENGVVIVAGTEEPCLPAPLPASTNIETDAVLTAAPAFELPPLDVESPRFNRVRLVFDVHEHSLAAGEVERILRENEIEAVLSSQRDASQEFAFLARAEQLREVFASLRQQYHGDAELIVADGGAGASIRVEKVTATQLLELALELNPTVRFATAERYRLEQSTALALTGRDAATDLARNDVPQLLAAAPRELPHLRTLANLESAAPAEPCTTVIERSSRAMKTAGITAPAEQETAAADMVHHDETYAPAQQPPNEPLASLAATAMADQRTEALAKHRRLTVPQPGDDFSSNIAANEAFSEPAATMDVGTSILSGVTQPIQELSSKSHRAEMVAVVLVLKDELPPAPEPKKPALERSKEFFMRWMELRLPEPIEPNPDSPPAVGPQIDAAPSDLSEDESGAAPNEMIQSN